MRGTSIFSSYPLERSRDWHTARQESVERRMQRLRRLAHWMDTAFRIPGTKYRVGFDSIIGLIPGVGDVATAAASAIIIHEAVRIGLPSHKIAKMTFNVGVDMVVGSLPLLGDLFDIGFKANKKNVEILEKHLEQSTAATRTFQL